ncbi:hypothetical protein FSP39_004189 [Pinctada imbricata]|uniref:cardiolipin synthase (CMP-forming) n=1 Tax=Pinctada imbricata TaxID=66713 RepID=A0AA88XVE2_PINIB|nr:hypothetical protein FSP39_004189 [Pinctada imbricata]
MSRIVATPWLGYLVVHDQFSLALGVFVVAGFTDMLDGYIARNFKNQQTVCGSFLDPLADKFLVSVLTISLTVAGLIPVPLTSLIVFRDLLLVIVAFYIRYLSIPPPVSLTWRYIEIDVILIFVPCKVLIYMYNDLTLFI